MDAAAHAYRTRIGVEAKVAALEKEEAKAARNGDYTKAAELKTTIAAWKAFDTAGARAQLDSGAHPASHATRMAVLR